MSCDKEKEMFAEVYNGVVFALHPGHPKFNAGIRIVDVSSYPEVAIGWLIDAQGIASAPPKPIYTASQLIAYAKKKASMIETGGITIDIASSGHPAQNIQCGTDVLSYARVSAASAFAIANPSAAITHVFPSGVVMLTAQQVETIFEAICNFYVAVQATWGAVMMAINAGTITTTAQIDTPPSPIPAWPKNS